MIFHVSCSDKLVMMTMSIDDDVISSCSTLRYLTIITYDHLPRRHCVMRTTDQQFNISIAWIFAHCPEHFINYRTNIHFWSFSWHAEMLSHCCCNHCNESMIFEIRFDSFFNVQRSQQNHPHHSHPHDHHKKISLNAQLVSPHPWRHLIEI